MSEELGVRERAKFGIRRLVLATGIALAVLALSLIAAWDTGAAGLQYGIPASVTSGRMMEADAAIRKFQQAHGRLPRTLVETPLAEDGPVLDGWGEPLHYRVEGSRFFLLSLGRDRKPGGQGQDEDLFSDRLGGSVARMPFQEFVAEPALRWMIVSCFAAAGLAFGLVLLTAHPHDFSRAGVVLSAGKIVVTGVAAMIVAMILIVLHTPSGH